MCGTPTYVAPEILAEKGEWEYLSFVINPAITLNLLITEIFQNVSARRQVIKYHRWWLLKWGNSKSLCCNLQILSPVSRLSLKQPSKVFHDAKILWPGTFRLPKRPKRFLRWKKFCRFRIQEDSDLERSQFCWWFKQSYFWSPLCRAGLHSSSYRRFRRKLGTLAAPFQRESEESYFRNICCVFPISLQLTLALWDSVCETYCRRETLWEL